MSLVNGHKIKQSACFNLEWLLNSKNVDKFFDEFWECQPLYIEAQHSSYFNDFYRFVDIETSIFNLDILQGDFSLFFDQKRVKDVSRYFDSENNLSGNKVKNACIDDGCTICIENIEKVNSAVQNLCNELSDIFLSGITTALFFGPPHSVGLNVHFDYYNAFILQLSGKKRWRVYSSVFDNPTCERDRFKVDKSTLGAPIIDIELQQGDILYIPRGCPHEPYCIDSHSLHLTVGIKTHCWADILHQSIEVLRDTESSFRQSLPPNDLLDSKAVDIKLIWDKLIGRMSDANVLDDTLWNLRELHYLKKSKLPRQTMNDPKRFPITLDSLLYRSSKLKPLVRTMDELTEIVVEGEKLTGPSYLAGALGFISNNRAFKLRDISSSINDNTKLKLGIKLVHCGLVNVIE